MSKDIYTILDTAKFGEGNTYEILGFNNLAGSADLRTAYNLYYASKSGMNLKMVRIKLANSNVRIEPGSLYFMKGNLEMKASTGGGIMKGLTRKMLSGETFFVNEIHGKGEIYLEPSFGYFLLYNIKKGDPPIIVDKGIFYAGTSGLNIGSVKQKNISPALFGGEGLFQTKIEGEGVAILYSPVPPEEIQKIELNDEKLSVDGNFALLRTEGITFKAEKSSKSWLATSVSGEGLLQTFSGTGTVWIAPTQGIYELLATDEGVTQLSLAPGTKNTVTRTSTTSRK